MLKRKNEQKLAIFAKCEICDKLLFYYDEICTKEQGFTICHKCYRKYNKQKLFPVLRRERRNAIRFQTKWVELTAENYDLKKERDRALKQRNTVSAEYKKLKKQLKELESRKDK